MPSTTTCPRCQSAIEAGSRFCQGCGSNLSGEQSLVGVATETASFQRPATLMDALQHVTLGEYEILHEIGQGGMATVYLAHDIALDRKVAIKVMSPSHLHGSEMISRFKREARTAASLNHPHIIPVYAVKEADSLLFFIMKYVKGRSLDAIIRDVGALPFPMVRTILTDVGLALEYAHRQGVVHRDVKPGNIMVEEEGFAVITDFGIAKAAESDTLTKTGTTVGTPSYLSPEACSGDKVAPASDQYSLGVVAYEMLTGQLPFVAESSMGMMYAQVHTPPRPSNLLRTDVPPDLHLTIMRMLEKRAEDRYPSLKDAVAAIRGGVPVGDDSVRSHIGLLAAPRADRSTAELRRTPSSPVPTGRTGSKAPLKATTPMPSTAAAVDGRRPWLWAVGAAVALAALGLSLLRHPAPPPTPVVVDTVAPATSDPADSLLLAARGAATYARQRAVAAGTTEKALWPADSLQLRAESLATQGRKAEAAVLLTSAASLWAGAERPAVQVRPAATPPPTKPAPSSSAAQTPTAPTTGAPTPAPAVAHRELSDSETVAEFYTELKRAIEARQLGEVTRLLPNLSNLDEQNWRNIFDDKNLEDIRIDYGISRVTRRGETAYARVVSDLSITKRGKTDHKQRQELVTLTLGPQGWRQIRSEKP